MVRQIIEDQELMDPVDLVVEQMVVELIQGVLTLVELVELGLMDLDHMLLVELVDQVLL